MDELKIRLIDPVLAAMLFRHYIGRELWIEPELYGSYRSGTTYIVPELYDPYRSIVLDLDDLVPYDSW